MSKKRKVFLAVAAIIIAVLLVAICCIASINPPKDGITDKICPAEFFCEEKGNHIDFQSKDNCAAYATAYVLRELGENTNGEEVAKEIKRFFGFVPARSIVEVFKNHGYTAKAYCGNTETLKQRFICGAPIIVFISVFRDTHYAVVVGYNEEYFYLADSLAENMNVEAGRYNRKITTEEFEDIWKTNTVLSDNIYICLDLNP